jgi:peroxiredoxin
VANAAGKKLMLAELPFGSSTRIVVDSATLLDDKGFFHLQTMQSQEGIYQLFVENGPGFLLINDADKIEVEVDAQAPEKYATTKSAATAAIRDLYKGFIPVHYAWRKAAADADSISKAGGISDSMRMVALNNRTNAQRQLSDYLNNWINQQANATASWFGMGMAKNYMAAADWKALFDATTEKFPRHPGLQQMKVLAAGNQQQGVEWIGKPLPELMLADSSGKLISTTQFKGRWLLLDVWASWCAPCRKENPNILAAYRQFNKRGLSIMSVSIDEKPEAWKTAMQADTLIWTNVLDAKGWESNTVNALNISALPFNLLIDPKGIVQAANLRGDTLLTKLAASVK